MSDIRPSNLKSEALSILSEIPLAYIQLHNERDNAHKELLLDDVRWVHHKIATEFGEPRPHNIGIQTACEDLTRWVNVWTWHPYATWWVRQLGHQLNAAQKRASDDRWFTKHEKVCPTCFTTGHLEFNPISGEHRCRRALDTVWSVDEYSDAVRAAVRKNTRVVS